HAVQPGKKERRAQLEVRLLGRQRAKRCLRGGRAQGRRTLAAKSNTHASGTPASTCQVTVQLHVPRALGGIPVRKRSREARGPAQRVLMLHERVELRVRLP